MKSLRAAKFNYQSETDGIMFIHVLLISRLKENPLMSKISMDAPTVHTTERNMHNLINFIFMHEQLLKEFGAIKIKLHSECKLAVKVRKMGSPPCSMVQQVVRVSDQDLIYRLRTVTCIDRSTYDPSLPTNENTFWPSLSSFDSGHGQRRSSVTILPKKSLFLKRAHRNYVDPHRLPSQSLLKVGGTNVTRQFFPSLARAHGPGAIFPLISARQRLFSLDYHHKGGIRQWYIVPARERETLQKKIQQQNASICLEHQNLLVDPSVFDKHHIRYHRLVQHPNEIVVLAAGALAQSFTEDSSWSESVAFALPSWLEDGHASACGTFCACDFYDAFSPEAIDIRVFTDELVQKYCATHLRVGIEDESSSRAGLPMNEYKLLITVHILDRNNEKSVMMTAPSNSTISTLNGNW
jgi:hypothetical protein